jgi:hypothetical protein
MGRFGVPLASMMIVALTSAVASAHHSFAAFFDSTKTVSVSGVVTEFRFTNPHGLITIEVTDAGGRKTVWRAETNSPSVLKRRGWTAASLRAGEVVTIEGWPGRDGTQYLRMSRVIRQDGSIVGTPLTVSTAAESDSR